MSPALAEEHLTMASLGGCNVVVTGASSGIGEAFAHAFAKRGCNVILAARRSDRLLSLCQQIHSTYSVSADWLSVDLACKEGRRSLEAYAHKDGREVDVLVNNAGLGEYNIFSDTPWRKHAQILQVNTVAVVELTHQFFCRMRERKGRCYILNVASILAYTSVPYFANYAATKAYVRAFSESLAMEESQDNVTVCCICPGSTESEFASLAGQRQLSRMPAEAVAEHALVAMLRGKTNIVPGRKNKLLAFLTRYIPRTWFSRIAPQLLGRPGAGSV